MTKILELVEKELIQLKIMSEMKTIKKYQIEFQQFKSTISDIKNWLVI